MERNEYDLEGNDDNVWRGDDGDVMGDNSNNVKLLEYNQAVHAPHSNSTASSSQASSYDSVPFEDDEETDLHHLSNHCKLQCCFRFNNKHFISQNAVLIHSANSMIYCGSEPVST